MIPTFLITRYGPKIAAAIFWGVLALLAILLAMGGYFVVRNHFQANLKTQVKVDAATTQAQAESGHDAVNTLGNVMSNEAATDTTTRENDDAISNASGATVAVDPAVRAAGLRALCRRPVYRDAHPACLQHAAP